MPRIITVIESHVSRGEGETKDDPCRRVIQYHTVDGDFLAEQDSWDEGHGYKEGVEAAARIVEQPYRTTAHSAEDSFRGSLVSKLAREIRALAPREKRTRRLADAQE